MNRITIIGHVGTPDNEMVLRTFSGETEKVPITDVFFTVRVATSNDYFDQDTNKWIDMPADWHNITWTEDKAIEMLEKIKCGDEVLVEGKAKNKKLKNGTFFSFIKVKFFKTLSKKADRPVSEQQTVTIQTPAPKKELKPAIPPTGFKVEKPSSVVIVTQAPDGVVTDEATGEDS